MKKTITEETEDLVLSDRLRAVGDLVRPFTLFSPLIAGIFISMVPILLDGGSVLAHWETLIYVGVTMALLQGGGQAINQAHPEEVKIDKANGKTYRPVPKGLLSEQEAMGVGMILIMFGITRAFTVNEMFGVFAMILAFFSIFYTLPPIRAKKRFILNIVWLGISRGFLPVVACFSVFNDPFDIISLTWGSLGFIWVLGFNVVKDIPDMKGDAEYDIPSLPVKIGKFGTVIHTASFMLVFIATSAYFVAEYLPTAFRWIYALSLIAILIPISLILDAPIPKLENNLAWVLFYLGLGLLFLIPPIAMLVM